MGGDGRGGWKASINEWDVESEGLEVVKEKCRVEWIRGWNGEEAWNLAKGREAFSQTRRAGSAYVQCTFRVLKIASSPGWWTCLHIWLHNKDLTVFSFYYISCKSRNVLWSPVSVCLSVSVHGCMRLHYCTDPDVTWGSGRGCGCPLVGHYWADLQSVHGLHCYGNITRTYLQACLHPAIWQHSANVKC